MGIFIQLRHWHLCTAEKKFLVKKRLMYYIISLTFCHADLEPEFLSGQDETADFIPEVLSIFHMPRDRQ